MGFGELKPSNRWFGTYIPSVRSAPSVWEPLESTGRIQFNDRANDFVRRLQSNPDIVFSMCKWERGPTGGSGNGTSRPIKVHLHYYVVLAEQCRVRQARRIIGVDDQQYLQPAKWPDSAKKYIEKPEESISDVFKKGGEPIAGRRPLGEEVIEFIRTGVSLKEFINKYPQYYLDKSYAVRSLISNFERYERRSAPFVVVLYGVTGSGKSHLADICCPPEDTYRKTISGKWHDGYQGEKHLIFDDFDPNELIDSTTKTVNLRQMLTQFDRYNNTRIEAKGTTMIFRGEVVFISTNFAPGSWVSTIQSDALWRRICLVRHYTEAFDEDNPNKRNYIVDHCKWPKSTVVPPSVYEHFPEVRKYLQLREFGLEREAPMEVLNRIDEVDEMSLTADEALALLE